MSASSEDLVRQNLSIVRHAFFQVKELNQMALSLVDSLAHTPVLFCWSRQRFVSLHQVLFETTAPCSPLLPMLISLHQIPLIRSLSAKASLDSSYRLRSEALCDFLHQLVSFGLFYLVSTHINPMHLSSLHCSGSWW